MAGSFTNLNFHFIFSTKYRESLIHPELRQDLHAYMAGILIKLKGCLIEAGGVSDHMHVLARLPATISVADTLRVVKANSSKWINEEHPCSKLFRWQDGYGAFTVSISQVEVVREYIRGQEAHHRVQSFQDEFLAFLKRHEVEYDPKYIWD